MDEDSIQMDVNDFGDEAEQVEEQPTTATDSSTEETKETEVAETEDGFESEKETEGKESDDSKEQESEAVETDNEDKPRAKNAAENRIRTLANENRELKQKIESLNQVYAPTPEQDLIEQGMSPEQAAVQSLREQIEVTEFNRRVTELNSTIESESAAVLNDFPIFDPESKDYNEALALRARAAFKKASAMQIDPNTGLVIQANVLPYDHYQSYADAYEEGAQKGKVSRQKANDQMLASVDVPSSAAPKQEQEDDFLKGFNSL
jgi:hypothetical protein